MSVPDSQENGKSPEHQEAGEKNVSNAERKVSSEAEGGKGDYYESQTRRARSLIKARGEGIRTATHKEFGTPTIEGDKGTLIKGGAPGPITFTEKELQQRLNDGRPISPAEKTSEITDYKPVQHSKSSFSLGMDYEDKAPEERTSIEKLSDFMQAGACRATDPEGWKAWAQGEINKFAGIGGGLNDAKEETKKAVAAGWKALTDGTVVEFLSQPSAINAPVFKTAANVFDAMSKDPNAVNKAFESLGPLAMQASEGYSNLPEYEKGKIIGRVMFGMVNPEGSTEDAEAAIKLAEQVATHVDKAVWDIIDQTMKAMKDMAPDLADQTKQALYIYIKDKGLTELQLEAAGIPREYFASMGEHAGGKGDNSFATSKADDAIPKRIKLSESAGDIEYEVEKHTGRLRRTDLGKVREPYHWNPINEEFCPDMIRQSELGSCASAVGEILSEGRLSEKFLISKMGEPANMKALAKELGDGWASQPKKFNSFEQMCENGPWAAELTEYQRTRFPKLPHVVVVDGVAENGNLLIRDPWEGTRYQLTTAEFKDRWTFEAVYRTKR